MPVWGGTGRYDGIANRHSVLRMFEMVTSAVLSCGRLLTSGLAGSTHMLWIGWHVANVPETEVDSPTLSPRNAMPTGTPFSIAFIVLREFPSPFAALLRLASRAFTE
jgi:hypothetical protein